MRIHGVNPVRAGVRRTAEVAVSQLAGDLELSTALDAERSLRAVEEGAPPRLVNDLRDVTFLDPTGLRMIVAADGRTRREHRAIVVVAGPQHVRPAFRTTLSAWRLQIVEDPSRVQGWGG